MIENYIPFEDVMIKIKFHPDITKEHKDNLKKQKIKLTCPICGIVGGANAIKRFHFDNCGKPYKFKRNK